MSPTDVLDAIRDLVEAAEAQGWDVVPDLKPVLDRGRQAYADLQMSGALDDDRRNALVKIAARSNRRYIVNCRRDIDDIMLEIHHLATGQGGGS